MTNTEIRSWYLAGIEAVRPLNERWIREGVALEERARRAWRFRHDLRAAARALMLDPLEVEALRARDSKLYGNPDGPTFEQLMEEERAGGLTEAQAYERIIQASQGTNEEANRRFGPSKPKGPPRT
jgi:hypothetical protein